QPLHAPVHEREQPDGQQHQQDRAAAWVEGGHGPVWRKTGRQRTSDAIHAACRSGPAYHAIPCPASATMPASPDHDDPIARTRACMQRAVIGLDPRPFAKAVAVRGQVRGALTGATTPEALLEELARELAHLRDTAPRETDTTLLVHPQVLGDFLDYNDFLNLA